MNNKEKIKISFDDLLTKLDGEKEMVNVISSSTVLPKPVESHEDSYENKINKLVLSLSNVRIKGDLISSFGLIRYVQQKNNAFLNFILRRLQYFLTNHPYIFMIIFMAINYVYLKSTGRFEEIVELSFLDKTKEGFELGLTIAFLLYLPSIIITVLLYPPSYIYKKLVEARLVGSWVNYARHSEIEYGVYSYGLSGEKINKAEYIMYKSRNYFKFNSSYIMDKFSEYINSKYEDVFISCDNTSDLIRLEFEARDVIENF